MREVGNRRTLSASGECVRERPLAGGAMASRICAATASRQPSMSSAECALASAIAMSPSATKPVTMDTMESGHCNTSASSAESQM